MKKQKFKLSTTHIILISFLAAILLGSLLLSLPISSATGERVEYIDALFTATTATCVTGLVTVTTAEAWSLFGQIVILLLIQIGGLGIITVMTGISFIFHKKLGLSRTLLLQDSFNLNTMSSMTAFIKKVILGTFAVEGVGALFYMTVFVRDFGARGIWISVFTSVSAFCNAGVDIIGSSSLVGYATDPIVNLTTCLLVILGGLGFIVWWDIIRVFKTVKRRRARFLSLHSKIALSTTAVLLVLGTAFVLAFEYNNPETIGNMSFFEKLQTSFFQSTTLRTAGFATVPQENLTNATSLICLIFMFIGGSPVGCAGGIKTVTFALLAATALSNIKNKNSTVLFNRRVPHEAVKKALAVTFVSLGIVFMSSVALAFFTQGDVLDILYETVSATATVGLSRNFTATFNSAAKLVVIATMYLGRVGPISLAVAAIYRRKNQNAIEEPVENISVG